MKQSFLKDLRSVLSSRILVIFLGLILSIITARYLGPEGNGIIAAIMIYPSLFISFGSLGIRQSATLFVGQGKYTLPDIYKSVLAIWILTSLISMILCFVLIYFTQNTPLELIFLAVVTLPFSLYLTYCTGIFLGQQNIKEFNRINWIPSAITLFITFILIGVFDLGVLGAMVGIFAGFFIHSFFVVKKMNRINPFIPKFNFNIISKMLKIGLVYALALLILSLNYKVDIIILQRLSNNHEIGIYSKGASLVEYLWQIPALLSTLIFSRSAASEKKREFSIKVCQLLRFASVIIFIGSIFLFLLSEFIITFLYGAAFYDSISVLKILIPGVLMFTIFKVLYMDLAGRGRPWVSIIVMLPAVIINIILNILWIEDYGANGSAAASTISYGLAGIAFLIVYSKIVHIKVKEIVSFNSQDKELLLLYISKVKNIFSK